MKTACIQQTAKAIWEYEETFAEMVALTRQAAREGAEMIVQPEAAYPAYFLGLDDAARDRALARSDEYLETMAGMAREHGVHIVACAAVRVDGILRNAAVMYDDRGAELGRAYKSVLWHFDAQWFAPGREYAAFDTRFGRVGMMICADGRVPEIARLLALDGAGIIIDPVNLVASAADPKRLMNQQYAFILPVRAMENGAWILVANKAGLEARTASYLGRSMIVDPNGDVVAEASTDQQEILHFDVDPSLRGVPPAPRRPELYGALARESRDLPAAADRRFAEGPETYVTAVQFAAADVGEYVEKAAFYCRAAAFLGTKLLCLPRPDFAVDAAAIMAKLRPFLKDGTVAAAAGLRDGVPTAAVFDRERVYGLIPRTHGPGPVSDGPIATLDTPAGTIGAVFGAEPYIPEVPRVNMLLGCDILLWFDDGPHPMNAKVALTRAAENRFFVVRTNPRVEGDTASVVTPDGAVAASAFAGVEQAVSAMAFLPLARNKNVVPGTDLIADRRGPEFGELARVR